MNRVDAEVPSNGYGISLLLLLGGTILALFLIDTPFLTGGSF